MPSLSRTNADVYVAFLDVLGFDSLVRNNSHESLEGIYSEALLGGLSLGLSNRNYKVYEVDGQSCLTNDVTATPVNSLVVSDSVIIWTNDDSYDAFRSIVSVVRGVLAHSCFNGLPLRGAIDVGQVSWLAGHFDSPTFNVQQSVFGLGLCRAYALEKDQEWSGCAIADEAIDRFKTKCTAASGGKPPLEELLLGKELCVFEVPFKRHPRSMHVIDWVNHPEVRARTETVADAFVAHGKLPGVQRLADVPSVKQKLENTLRFVRHVYPEADKCGMAAAWAALGLR